MSEWLWFHHCSVRVHFCRNKEGTQWFTSDYKSRTGPISEFYRDTPFIFIIYSIYNRYDKMSSKSSTIKNMRKRKENNKQCNNVKWTFLFRTALFKEVLFFYSLTNLFNEQSSLITSNNEIFWSWMEFIGSSSNQQQILIILWVIIQHSQCHLPLKTQIITVCCSMLSDQ